MKKLDGGKDFVILYKGMYNDMFFQNLYIFSLDFVAMLHQ